MTNAAETSGNKPEMRRPRSKSRLFVLCIILGTFVYFGLRGSDWTARISALQEWLMQKPSLDTQPPAKHAGKATRPAILPPSFDLVYADETGKLVAAGRGEAGWTISISSKAGRIGETKTDDNGEWVLTPDEPLAPGDHVLSLLEVDPVGERQISGERTVALTIASRPQGLHQAAGVREAPQAAPQEEKNCAVVRVKPGDSLWGIASRCYGDGAKYPAVFEANRSAVSNPNLIYPDQQLALPH